MNLFGKTDNSFEFLVQYYVDYLSIRFSERTVKTYLEHIRKIISLLDVSQINNDLRQLKHQFEQVLIELKEYSVSYRNLTISVFNDFCKFLCKNKQLLCNTKFMHIKKALMLPKFIPQTKLLNMLNTLHKNRRTWIDYRNYALIYLLYATGLRISEALNLEMTDFIKDGMLLVRNGKNSKQRIVYFPHETLDNIKAYRLLCPHNTTKFLWKNKNGNILTRHAANVAIKDAINHAPHALRHSFATHLHGNGCDIFIISELLGHESLYTTQIYTKVQKNELKKCIIKHHPLSNMDLNEYMNL